jgi:predicted alpha/beta superfamily hydrolase
MKTTAVLPTLLLLCVYVPASHAQSRGEAFSIPGIEQHEFVSKINGLPYRITVALPFTYSPGDTAHYPVMYLLDGDPNLPLAALIQWNMTYDNEVPKMILVGVGYQAPGFMGTVAYRALDYTPVRDAKADSEMTANHHRRMVSGGAAEFLRVMQEEIMPYIGQQYRVSNDRALGGHSFGGLFAAYVLFTRPGLFKRYLISSPSLYWSGDEISKEEAHYFAAGNRDLPARVFLSAGANEPDEMVPEVNGLAWVLKSRGYPHLELTERIFEDETHLSVIPFAISRGIRVLYK